jgi:hypothetical protein
MFSLTTDCPELAIIFNKMPVARRPDWINWKASRARQIILDDLEHGILPVDDEECSIEEAWTFYSQMAEFVTVVFSQFKERVRDHRKQCREQITRSDQELEMLAHDRQLFPRQMVNHRGEPVFELSPAKMLLRADVREGKHLTMTPSQLQLSQTAYAPFDPKIFMHRIYQEVRREKFLNYLAKKRAGILK